MILFQGKTWISPGHLGAEQKDEDVRSPQRKKKKRIRERMKKIKKREGRSRIDSLPRKIWKGKRRG